MPAQTVTLTDELAASETTAFILVTSQQAFTDADGKSHGKTVRTDYGTPDATPTLSAPVVASDAAGNVPSPVLYTIRRVLGSGTTEWKDVYLAASDGTVPLGQLETQPGVNPVTVARVLSVDGQGPDADGNVQIDAATKMPVVVHGSTAGTARPTSSVPVQWIGSVAPSNATTNDLWWDTAALLSKRFNGTAWDASGGAAYAPIGSVMTLLDNGDGTSTLSGSGVVDNGDGTVTITA